MHSYKIISFVALFTIIPFFSYAQILSNLEWDITYCDESTCYDAYKMGKDRYIVEVGKTTLTKTYIPNENFKELVHFVDARADYLLTTGTK